MAEQRRGYHITGTVQGVGYRWWTRREARALGVRGTVRNRVDGSVEVVAAGTPEQLDRLEACLRRGPPAATVTAVIAFDPEDAKLPGAFEIIR